MTCPKFISVCGMRILLLFLYEYVRNFSITDNNQAESSKFSFIAEASHFSPTS